MPIFYSANFEDQLNNIAHYCTSKFKELLLIGTDLAENESIFAKNLRKQWQNLPNLAHLHELVPFVAFAGPTIGLEKKKHQASKAFRERITAWNKVQTSVGTNIFHQFPRQDRHSNQISVWDSSFSAGLEWILLIKRPISIAFNIYSLNLNCFQYLLFQYILFERLII